MGSGLSPGKDFDDRGDVRELLQRHGWTGIGNSGNDERWRRPGKDHGISATLKDGRLFYCFTSSAAGLEGGKGYGPFGLFTALSLGFCVQPEILRGLMQQKSFRGRGLLLDLPVRQNDNGEFLPEVLSLARDADDQFRVFRDEIEARLGEFGTFATIKDWAGKLPGAVARIAGLMHVVEHVECPPIPTVISGDTTRNAIRLGRYFASHATAVFRIMGRDESVALAEHIVHTIQRHDMREFSKQKLHQQVRRRVDLRDELDSPLKIWLVSRICG